MNNLNPQTSLIASGEALRPLLDTLQSMETWALDSIAYVNPRSHLSLYQKHYLKERINQRITLLQQRISELQTGTLELPVTAIESAIQEALIGQAEFNRYAWFYEFPRFALPESIDQPFSFDLDLASEEKGNLERMLYYGDDLQLDTIHSLSALKVNDTLLITYRDNYKEPRLQELGWFQRLEDNSLVMQVSRSEEVPYWSIPMNYVIHIHRIRWVKTINAVETAHKRN